MTDTNLFTRTLPAAVQSEDYGKLIKPFDPAADTARPKRKPRAPVSPPYTQRTCLCKDPAFDFVTVNVAQTEHAYTLRVQYHAAGEKPENMANVLRFHIRRDAEKVAGLICSGYISPGTVKALQSVFDPRIVCDWMDKPRRDIENGYLCHSRRPDAYGRSLIAEKALARKAQA